MKITYTLINQIVSEGVQILKEVYPSFQYRGFTKVRISRARSKWGSVKYNSLFDAFELTISDVFEEIKDEKKAKNRLLSTVIHELIHTIPGCMNHGSNFKYYAVLVNREYSFLHVQRCTSMEEYGVERKKNPKYTVRCADCSREWKFMRRTSTIDRLQKCYCPYCKTFNLYIANTNHTAA